MIDFIQNNLWWITPIVCIVLSILIKISAKPSQMSLGFMDFIDFGFELSISSVVALLVEIKSNMGAWLLFFSFFLIILTSVIVSRVGWDKDTKKPHIGGVLLSDAVGIFLLIIIGLYIRGVNQ